MEPLIRDMNSQQLRAALNAENNRIEGANAVRKTIQMSACIVGVLGWIIPVCLMKNQNDKGVLCLSLWLGCWLVYWRSKPKPPHYLYDNNWEDKAREILEEAEWARLQRALAEREAENEED